MSKGSNPRPIEVPKDDFYKRWEAIFWQEETSRAKEIV